MRQWGNDEVGRMSKWGNDEAVARGNSHFTH